VTPPEAGGVYWAIAAGQIDARWASDPARVYVPDEKSGDVVVIDPATFEIVDRFKVGTLPEHVTPDWDGSMLYVNNMGSGGLTEIDPSTARPTGRSIPIEHPYNLYFTPDGRYAIDVMDGSGNDNGLRFIDRATWQEVKFVRIPWTGANHLDFTEDGSKLLVSCERSGRVVSVDLVKLKILGATIVGGFPTDVRLSPDGEVFFVANQGRDLVDVVRAADGTLVGSINAGSGAHGLALSHDGSRLFVSNRRGGSMTVIDTASHKVVATWRIGGMPDMIAVSTDGSQLWISNRHSGSVTVIDSSTGVILANIKTGLNPHGLAYWPQPGRYSLGHNGNMR
jgi:YVTN family beta-propeller protein